MVSRLNILSSSFVPSQIQETRQLEMRAYRKLGAVGELRDGLLVLGFALAEFARLFAELESPGSAADISAGHVAGEHRSGIRIGQLKKSAGIVYK